MTKLKIKQQTIKAIDSTEDMVKKALDAIDSGDYDTAKQELSSNIPAMLFIINNNVEEM